MHLWYRHGTSYDLRSQSSCGVGLLFTIKFREKERDQAFSKIGGKIIFQHKMGEKLECAYTVLSVTYTTFSTGTACKFQIFTEISLNFTSHLHYWTTKKTIQKAPQRVMILGGRENSCISV